jgi:DNA-binding transcriptional LysR family regulator
MDRLKLMETFVAVVQAGSYASAARQLGVTRALVSIRLQDLEGALSVRLLNRDNHHVSTTPMGAEYYETCLSVLSEIQSAEEALRAGHATAKGPIKILSSHTFGEQVLSGIITEFCLAHPDVSIQLTLADRHVLNTGLDLISGGYDMAVRTIPPRDSALIAHPITDLQRILVASPAYLAEHGTPDEPRQLPQFSCLDASGLPRLRWDFEKDGKRMSVPVNGRLAATSSAIIRRATLAGLGIAKLSPTVIAKDVKDGTLQQVLAKYPMPFTTLYLIYQRDRQRPLRVRLFMDYIKKAFKNSRNGDRKLQERRPK